MRSTACLIVHCRLINSLADTSTSVSFRSFEIVICSDSYSLLEFPFDCSHDLLCLIKLSFFWFCLFSKVYLVLALHVMRCNFRLAVVSMRSTACLIVHCSLINSLADTSTSVSFRSFESDSSLVLSVFLSCTLFWYFM